MEHEIIYYIRQYYAAQPMYTGIIVAIATSVGVVLASAITFLGIIMSKKMDRKDKKKADMSDFEKQLLDKMQAFGRGVNVLLYDRIKYLGNRYIGEECISGEELNDLKKLHTVFHKDLGGNGYLDEIMRRVGHLQINNSKSKREYWCQKHTKANDKCVNISKEDKGNAD